MNPQVSDEVRREMRQLRERRWNEFVALNDVVRDTREYQGLRRLFDASADTSLMVGDFYGPAESMSNKEWAIVMGITCGLEECELMREFYLTKGFLMGSRYSSRMAKEVFRELLEKFKVEPFLAK